ncbi:bifunctional serine/threonine-protein kinase/formylglycine-generating enzyme family protein [Teredinibacter turnerae]|uniref:bifunctional serine/threonine-protein kinase/formylglycine-generating enzyme family protein n=1 Tax=Teredinibacter turnerae TaxID=2426 RepID=UPI0005F7DDCE|nr:bifunctional serine/threonine-protein kinase/formylglycine-generating enzyme family protein [Teredinibacter turnerae]
MDNRDNKDSKTPATSPGKKPLEAPSDATVIKRAEPSRAPAPEGDDKTRIAKNVRQQKHINAALQKKTTPQAPPADKTRLKSHRPAVNIEPKKSAPSDKTSIRSAGPQAQGDKTQFNPRARATGQRQAKPARSRPESGRALEPGQSAKNTSSGAVPTLKNRFIFEEMLGAGGMGMVYKAKDMLKVEAQDRDPFVAIKVLGDEFKSHPEAFIALQRESRKTQQIAHPNIVNVFDFDKDGDTVFMTMEFLDGKPLDKLISQYKATGLPESEVWQILEGISAALIYAHGQNIIHSDFKPGNIFVTNKGLAKVFDFGIARAVAATESHEDDPEDRTVFDAGSLGALTPAYASKEMLEGLEPDVRDDIYALGCIAYEMFTGRHPFDRVHANEAARLGLKPERIPQLTKAQWRAIEKCLAFEREDRVESVEEFWRLMTQKRQSYIKLGIVITVFAGLFSALGYLYYLEKQTPQIDTENVRSQIEMKLRIEQHQNNIVNLTAAAEFSKGWEAEIWSEVQALAALLGSDDPWLIKATQSIYLAYLQTIEQRIADEDLPTAERLLNNAVRYAGDLTLLEKLQTSYAEVETAIAERVAAEEERARAAKVKAVQVAAQKAVEQERRDIYNQAMKNVDEQTSCRSGLNTRDLKIALNKLREVDPARYRKAESGIVKDLSACIAKIGRSFPERATEYKKQAIKLFPGNLTIANVAIVPKDPCDLSLAGLGARGKRAICRDRLAGEEKGPSLVVIPAKGSMKAFALGKYEVSVDEWNQFCASDGNCPVAKNTSGDLPITSVSSNEVKRYLAWISDKAKRKYRLPTRAEWEYAARAGQAKLDSNRNCKLNSRGIQKGDSLIKTDVGAQNRWGLVNHVGNARELVADRGGALVAIGGSFQTPMEDCTANLAESFSRADDITGFRVLREIVER